MPSRNDPMRRAARIGLIPLMLLTACANEGVRGPSASAALRTPPKSVSAALCEGRAADAAQSLAAEPLEAPSDRFYTALALEESGHAARARVIYADLMNGGYTDYVRLKCGSRTLADGTIAEESGKHLAMIARVLQSMDVTMAPSLLVPAGLPAQAPAAGAPSTKGKTASHQGPISVEKPASQNPLGRWFAHLASYRSFDNAQENRPALEKKFPGLATVLDQWEVDVKGFAIRMGVRVSNKDDAKALCDAIQSQGEFCAVLDTDS